MKTMTISITRRSGLPLVLLLTALAAGAQGNPHWDKASCQTCHATSAPVSGATEIRGGDIEALCDSCHGERGDAVACRHRSDLAVGEMPIADSYRPTLRDGKIVCSTCHDSVFQCNNPNVAYSFQNPGFLRNRVSRKSGDQCFECHSADGYAKLDPHLDTIGSPPRKTCGLCHERVQGGGSNDNTGPGLIMAGNLNDMCRGCHRVKSHPLGMRFGSVDEGWVHLVVPSADVVKNMRESESESGVALPLNPGSGEVMCATCHDPHPARAVTDHGVSGELNEHRLRLDDICQACHDK